MKLLRAMFVSVLLVNLSATALAAAAGSDPPGRSDARVQIPRLARDPVLASLPVLVGEPGAAALSDQAPAVAPEIVTLSARAREFRHLLGDLLYQGTKTVRRVGEAFLPEQPQPGLQFSIDPDTDEVFVGWRFRF